MVKKIMSRNCPVKDGVTRLFTVMLAEEGHVTAGEEVRMSGKPMRTKAKVPKVSWTK
jgi:hypothetical protein